MGSSTKPDTELKEAETQKDRSRSLEMGFLEPSDVLMDVK